MMIEGAFEKISKYANDDQVKLPYRKTAGSAGYDFYAAEDTIIPPWDDHANNIFKFLKPTTGNKMPVVGLEEFESITKSLSSRPTLVPTGVKCKLPEGYYLMLASRSSMPLKNWLLTSNGVGVIDLDYYNNESNEGHIYFQMINLSPVPIIIHKGECFGQGIILEYNTFNNEQTSFKERTGGFGSTNK